jgi:SAM-dependent methyltransferase
VVRDAWWLSWFVYHFDDGVNTDEVLRFKENLPFLSDQDVGRYYALRANSKTANRPTDLNNKCVSYILKQLEFIGGGYGSILDAGGGRCHLAKLIFAQSGTHVTVLDIQCPKDVPDGVNFVSGNIKQMPFEDGAFDLTLCTHTLEHIRDPKPAITELLRVTKRKLIIVMPKQREYRYSVDLHINYCPYMYSFMSFVDISNAEYHELGGDFICTATFDV